MKTCESVITSKKKDICNPSIKELIWYPKDENKQRLTFVARKITNACGEEFVNIGIALCSKKDTFVKSIGRRLARENLYNDDMLKSINEFKPEYPYFFLESIKMVTRIINSQSRFKLLKEFFSRCERYYKETRLNPIIDNVIYEYFDLKSEN